MRICSSPAGITECDMRDVFRGLQGDLELQRKAHEEGGQWVQESYDSDLLERERLMAKTSCLVAFVDGLLVMSSDDDLAHLRSTRSAAAMGLSCHINLRKGMGAVQVAVCDALLGFHLCWHYLKKG